MSLRPFGFFLSLAALVACGPSAQRPPSVASPDATPFDALPVSEVGLTDASAPPVERASDLGSVDAPRDVQTFDGALRPYPPGPYGVFVGTTFEPFSLTDCSNRPYLFAGPEFSVNRATVVVLNAGYSANARALSAGIQSLIEVPYRGHAIRVVEVLVEGESVREPASNAFCQSWADANRLTHPLLIDPTSMLGERVPMRMFPMVFLLDDSSRIVWLSNNGATAAMEARQQLARLVGEP